MRRFSSNPGRKFILLTLVVGVLCTIPFSITRSKYVWKDDIVITLDVRYSDQILSSLLPPNLPASDWILSLANIQATRQNDGLLLCAEQGYQLPEEITVLIGTDTYTVHTNGQENPGGIAFAPETGMLSISSILIAENPTSITVIASAEQTVPAEGTAMPSVSPEPLATIEPTEQATHTATVKPTEQVTPTATTKPTEQVTPAATTKHTEQVTPAATTKHTEQVTPAATTKPTEQVTPAATIQPTEQVTPAATIQPTEQAALVATLQPTEQAALAATTKHTEQVTPTATLKPTEQVTPTATLKPTEQATPAATTKPPEPTVSTTLAPTSEPVSDTSAVESANATSSLPDDTQIAS